MLCYLLSFISYQMKPLVPSHKVQSVSLKSKITHNVHLVSSMYLARRRQEDRPVVTAVGQTTVLWGGAG